MKEEMPDEHHHNFVSNNKKIAISIWHSGDIVISKRNFIFDSGTTELGFTKAELEELRQFLNKRHELRQETLNLMEFEKKRR